MNDGQMALVLMGRQKGDKTLLLRKKELLFFCNIAVRNFGKF
jgi:hypothetical protein